MTSPRLWKTWRVSDSLLRSARSALPDAPEQHRKEFADFDSQFAEMLENNEHELALDFLQEMAGLVQTKGGFWKQLEQAAVNMDLDDRVPFFRSEFNKALLTMK